VVDVLELATKPTAACVERPGRSSAAASAAMAAKAQRGGANFVRSIERARKDT
jgi:hypothetical protein